MKKYIQILTVCALATVASFTSYSGDNYVIPMPVIPMPQIIPILTPATPQVNPVQKQKRAVVKYRICSLCHGSGIHNDKFCPSCLGKGKVANGIEWVED